jgi:hypothetical protein
MKKLIIILIFSTVTGSLFAQRRSETTVAQTNPKTDDFSFVEIQEFEGFIPQEPIIYTGDLPVWGGGNGKEEAVTKESMLKLVNQQEKLKSLLPDFSIDFYIRKIGTEGVVLYGLSAVTGTPGAYEIIYDITKSTTVPVAGSSPGVSSTPSSFIKVGVGIRIKAIVTTTKANIEVSNLNHLALAEANGDLKGGLSFMLFGLVGEEVINMAPNSTAMINLSSIDSFMQSIAILKSRLYDAKTVLVPRIFSVQRNAGDIPLDLVSSANKN